MQHKEPLMKHSVSLVTETTSGLGYTSASMLAAEGCRQVIDTWRSLSRVQETVSHLAPETKTQVFAPLELQPELDEPSSLQSALAALARRLPSGMAV
jgi:NAD(P)-dependent dehydrogenase (short-subunit alcohol dehydrogenase family)